MMPNNDYSERDGAISKKQLLEINNQLEKQICKINEKNITGFFCKLHFPDQFHLLPVLITNSALNKEDLKINMEIKLTINSGKKEIKLFIDKLRKVYTNEFLDITIIELYPKEKDNFNNLVNINEFIEYFELDYIFDKENNREIYNEKNIYLLIYLFDQYASFSEGILKGILDKTIQHNCFNKSYSSGGPIVLKSNYKVVGVLRREIKAQNNNLIYHEGTLIKYANEEFINYIINKEINKNIQFNYNSSNSMNNENNNMDKQNNNINEQYNINNMNNQNNYNHNMNNQNKYINQSMYNQNNNNTYNQNNVNNQNNNINNQNNNMNNQFKYINQSMYNQNNNAYNQNNMNNQNNNMNNQFKYINQSMYTQNNNIYNQNNYNHNINNQNNNMNDGNNNI